MHAPPAPPAPPFPQPCMLPNDTQPCPFPQPHMYATPTTHALQPCTRTSPSHAHPMHTPQATHAPPTTHAPQPHAHAAIHNPPAMHNPRHACPLPGPWTEWQTRVKDYPAPKMFWCLLSLSVNKTIRLIKKPTIRPHDFSRSLSYMTWFFSAL